MTKYIDTVTIRSRLKALRGFTKKAWSATGFCRVRKDDSSWHESSKISVQRGVYGSMSPQDARLAAAAPELHAMSGALCDELDEARAEIAKLRAELEARPLLHGEVGGASLDARLKAKGMFTVEETMRPMNGFQVHAGMKDITFFEAWLERQARSYGEMMAGYELGDEDKGDELYEWVLAHRGAYHDALVNFRAAKACEATIKRA